MRSRATFGGAMIFPKIFDFRNMSKTREAAQAFMASSDWARAARTWRQVIADQPHPDSYVQYGHALKEAGFFSEARAAYDEALRRGGDEQDILLQLGHLSKVAGRFDDAAGFYRSAFSATKHNAAREEILREAAMTERLISRRFRAQEDGPHIFFSCASGISLNERLKPTQLGRANYSYGFAMQGFLSASDALQLNWSLLQNPEYCSNASVLSDSRQLIHLCFAPPRLGRILKGAYNILCFAWEFPVMPDDADWAHAFASPRRMLDLFDELWVGSEYTASIVRSYTARAVRVVPSPIMNRARSARRQKLPNRTGWVPLSVFARLQENFNNYAVGRSRRLSEIIGFGAPRVFLSVFNVHDLRKQVGPMIRGFLEFERAHGNAVLLLKMASPSADNRIINQELLERQLDQEAELVEPLVSERIWLTADAFSDDQMDDLYGLAEFYLCTSHCEGQNLPLMEAMLRGVVPISVCHTAMLDYVNEDRAVVVPHETADAPMRLQNTYRIWGTKSHFVNANDVTAALVAATKLDKSRYDEMSASASMIIEQKYGAARFEEAFAETLSALGTIDLKEGL
jgi:glycosyltransferase involved in cell wall biosynthesis